ncbi:MAG: hypothetical protein WC337_07545 [Candidatus Muiribacteriota bacterium]
MSRKFIIITIFTSIYFLFTGCSSRKVDSIEHAVFDESQNKSVAQLRLESETQKSTTTLEDYLSVEELGNPMRMYIANKRFTAQSQVKTAYAQVSLNPGEQFYFETQRLESIRNLYISGEDERAFIQSQTMLNNQSLSPITQAELYFIMADISQKNQLRSESLEFIDKAYEAMKKIPKMPHIIEKTSNFHELLDTAADINKIKLLPPDDDDFYFSDPE